MDTLDIEELIEGRAGVHDRYRVEVKLDYAVDPQRRRNRYRVDAFFFIPRSLGITSDTYSRDHFYEDVQAHIRFKTPEQTMPAMLDPANEISPLTRLQKWKREVAAWTGDRRRTNAITEEMRLFGCLVRVRIRDRSNLLIEKIGALSGRTSVPDLVLGDFLEGVRSLDDDTRAVLEAFRALRPDYARQDLPGWFREAYTFTDEYLSLMTEEYLTRLVAALDGATLPGEGLAEVRGRLAAAIRREQAHRRSAGYETVVEPGGSNEHLEYRRGLLKKFVNSVLYLEVKKEKEGRRAGDVAAAGAAAVAMVVATVAAILAQQLYGLNTLPFVLALVAAYMVKDRLKEWLRQFFASRLAPFLADYSVKIHDPLTGHSIGHCREGVSFLPERAVPHEVMAKRHARATSATERKSKHESVLHYRKVVNIRGEAVDGGRRRLSDVNDIIRLGLGGWLARCDDPGKSAHWLNGETGQLETLRLPRVYHINLVLRLRALDRKVPPKLEHLRIVVDRDGILRLEHQ
ncbi:MAG: hypothetical protein P1V51_11775 [Deltaproteobacteria bacterium]|nr:hypothetical protein [Deltaproteobacteria bacterium]